MRVHLASLVDQFLQQADDTAVVAHRGNRRYRTTYGELATLSGRFAAELDRRALVPGDRVILWGANSAEWIAAFFGCLLRGIIAVPLDAAGSPEFAARIVKDVSPRLIVGDRALLDTLTIASTIPQLYLFDFNAQLPTEPNFAVSEAVTKDAPLQIVFTSGTTSEPKGIVHTHANVLASVLPIEREMYKYRRYIRWVHPLRFLQTLPLSHVFGQFMCLWLPPLLAGEVHFAEQLEARRMTDLIRRERISVLVAVPRVIQLLRAHLLKRFDDLASQLEQAKPLSKWKRLWHFRKVRRALGLKFWAIISGGAALPTDLEAFWGGIAIPVIQGYGMTETTALVTLNHPFKASQGSIGKTLPGRELRLSEDGEILVRGEMLSTATWQHGAIQAREGEWLATGDLGAKDESGELHFVGRKGDTIVTGGGMNIHPDDLERAMKLQPGIRDCAVVPCDTPGGTEAAAVVLFTGNAAQLQVAVQAANKTLADFQQIRRVLPWPEAQFPYTSTGKLKRRMVAEWVRQTIANLTQQPSSPEVGDLQTDQSRDIVLDLIAEVTGERAPGTEDTLRLAEDLLLDSLGRVQLQTSIEQRLDLELPDDALASLQTLGELRSILSAHGMHRTGQSAQPTARSVPIPDDSRTSRLDVPGSAQPASELEADTIPQATSSSRDDRNDYASEHLYPNWSLLWPFSAIRSAFLELIAQPLIWFLAAPRVVGPATPLPPGPLLVIGNHVTAYDGPLILYALPGRLRRRTAIAMSGEMLLDYRKGRNQSNWLLNLLAPPQYWLVTALYNVFPLPRLHGFRRSFLHAGQAMDCGYSVMVFPEGARHFDGKLRAFRSGIGLLAQESRVPIVPVAMIGLDEMHRTGWFRSGLLEIRIGEAIPVNDSIDPAELTAHLEEALRKLQS